MSNRLADPNELETRAEQKRNLLRRQVAEVRQAPLQAASAMLARRSLAATRPANRPSKKHAISTEVLAASPVAVLCLAASIGFLIGASTRHLGQTNSVSANQRNK
ncbi:hypothetical protein [Roseibium sp.]|uniref:hypothetical protein n=1 Tax=Roseibium sp. TaxID=1936156 RepID=UPI003A96ABF1